MKKRILKKYLFFVIIIMFFEQTIFAQKTMGINTEVKISIFKKIGISFGSINPSKQKSIVTSGQELPKRDILVNYNATQNSKEPFSEEKPILNIVRQNDNLSSSIPIGSEKELRRVTYDDNILISIIDECKKTRYPSKHLVTIVY